MKYPVFLQALALTIVVFAIGMYIGIVFEENRLMQINNYYIDSEVSMIDILSLNNMIGLEKISCSELEEANINLLNRVYEEAIILQEFEDSGRITNNLKGIHKKYDALRTYLWVNSIQIKESCNSDFNLIVYLYRYEEKDLVKRAEQTVWSRLLLEVKNSNKNVVLIPIAIDTDLESIGVFIEDYNIEKYPAVIINQEVVLQKVITKEEIESYLN